jgi:hypothetical protein
MRRLSTLSRDDLDIVLRAYRRWVVPGDRWPLMFLKLRGGWRAAKQRRTGALTRLSDYYLEKHLRGHLMVGARWRLDEDFAVRLAVIDVDADRRVRSRSRRRSPFNVRVRAIRVALRGIGHLAIRSSSSTGVHFYIFLDRAYPAPRVRAALQSLLEAAELRIAPGEIEIWPSRQPLRLPLGRGSCILDRTLRPMFAEHDAAGRLRRDVLHGVVYLNKYGEKHQVSLRRLERASHDGHAKGGVTHKRSNVEDVHAQKATRSPGGNPAPTARLHTYRDLVAAAQRGVSEPGRRFEEASRLVWDLRVAQGLPPATALLKFNEWLDHGEHHSDDLERDPAGTRARMKKDAERYLAHLERRIAAGELWPGRGGGPGAVSLLAVVRGLRAAHGRAWRDIARARLTTRDRHLLATRTRDAWLRDHVGVLIGVLRIALAHRPPATLVSMHRTALVAIAGGKPRPSRAPRRVQRKLGVSAYRTLRRAAERYGLIELASGYLVGVTARQFRVSLPGRPSKEPHDE